MNRIRTITSSLAVVSVATLGLLAASALRPARSDVPLAPGLASAAVVGAGSGAPVPYLEFVGTGSAPISPDRAQIGVGVSARAVTPVLALRARRAQDATRRGLSDGARRRPG